MSSFFKLYFRFTDWLIRSPWLIQLGVGEKRIAAFRESSWKNTLPITTGARVSWFHAASVGELEILMPLIQEWMQKGIPVGVSVFSESAIPYLKKLPEGLIYAGFSPRESEWNALLGHFSVNRVIVSKYEAWPGLWAAVSLRDATLVLINAQPRASLKWVKRALAWGKIDLPALLLSCTREEDQSILQRWFPLAKIVLRSDPRWLRVAQRAQLSSTHLPLRNFLSEIGVEIRTRPFLVVGSAWIQDLGVLVPALKKTQGTLWVVPHSLDAENLQLMKRYLQKEIPNRFVLVARAGLLVELYSIADRVWVGGGFGKGIHSTLEPAVYGVPVACGPKRVEEFAETSELIRSGQLTVCKNEADALAWLEQPLTEKNFPIDQKIQSFAQLVEDAQGEARYH